MMHGDYSGKQVDDYRIEECIGQGGMATVYRAYQASMNRYVALKLIPYGQDAEHEEFRRRFAQEAEVIIGLEHIHILPIYGYGIASGVAYLAMRLLSGGSLSDLLADGPLPLDRAAEIFGQVARGLAYAHGKGIIHRDVKPSNILLDDAGNAYLTDFGLAKWIKNAATLTETGSIVGTPAYMSPEQLRGAPVDQRADIYSMGVVLYHMVAGRPPFESSSTDVISIIYQHLEGVPAPPSTYNPAVSPSVDAVVLRALQKDPALRYNSVRLMADELDAALGRRISTSSFTSAPLPVEARRRAGQRRPRWLRLAAVGAVVTAALALLALLVLRPGSDTPSRPRVNFDASLTAAEIAPSRADSARAQQVLDDGFVAYVTCNQSSEYHAAQVREIGELLQERGLAYRVYDSDTDEYRQLTLIERARTDGAQALIVCPLNSELLDKPLRAVEKAGLPLVLLSGELPNYGGVLMVGDEFLIGRLPGELAGQIVTAERGGQARVIILDYAELPHIVERANGLEAGLLAYAPQAVVIGRFRGGTRDFGRQSVSRLLAEGQTFDVILSINDAGTFGAVEALEAAGVRPDEVIITSVDAEALARRYIRDSYYLRGSTDVGRMKFSRAIADAVTGLLAGAEMPGRVHVPPDLITRASFALETPKQDGTSASSVTKELVTAAPPAAP
ncbi:MAG: protein kinase domain-containing protein [Aggregatilineales bacterium]